MRGTGYAIGEILVFLAIAAIIGFLIGWLVFYRRPTQDSAKLSPVNPNHVKRLEERSRAVDGKLARIEKRANALLETLAQAPRPGGVAATTATGEAARAVDKVEAGAKDTKDKVEAGAKDTKDKIEAGAKDTKDKIETGAQQTKDKIETGAQPAKDKIETGAQPAKDKIETGAQPAKDKAEAGAQQAKDTAGAETGDDYLSEADERISKLEETLDKLSEKLAEFDDD